MKKLFYPFAFALTAFLILYSCSAEEEDTTPPPTVQQPTPEPEPEVSQFTLTVTAGEGGTVSTEGGTYDEGTEVTITASPAEGYEFVGWEGIDSNEQSIIITISEALSITANYIQLEIESIEVLNPIESLVISRRHKFQVQGIYSNGETIDLTDEIDLVTTDDKITLLDGNEFTAGKSGDTVINISYGNLSISQNFFVNYYEEILNEFEGEYLTQNSDVAINVPIVIVNFHPTTDGINIDSRRYLDDYFIKDRYFHYYGLDRNVCENVDPNNLICSTGTLEMYKIRAKEIDMFTKFGIEEGSKFRAPKNPSVSKSINIEVLKYYNFYELEKKTYQGQEVPQPDYQKLFSTIDLENLVNNYGVKEVWISIPPLSIEYPWIQQGLISSDFLLNLPESNMSGPNGDISNSIRISNDLPVYKNSYVVYGINVDRGPSESLHNRGHQIEVQLREIEKNKESMNELFWNNFVGVNESGKPIGRAGMTHFPPNTSIDYDYCNQNLVETDIMNWLPQGGQKEFVNCDVWTNISYDYPFESIFWSKNSFIDNISKDSGYKWFIYWFQSIPGLDNNIPYTKNGNNYTLTNWWDLFYNWDEAITNDKTLWE
ncbi:hypothetical protein OAN99_02565 [Flavobacteriaceae bacterium]|nr:hypothetical protein [Flavobacteriaceae bacterium]